MGKISISRLAKAKINLDLLITGRRADGYHLLDSLVVFADHGDMITVSPADNIYLIISGPFAEGLDGEENNIILKAAHLIREKFDVTSGAKIKLVKNLPVASGIGGGSADAAATIHALMTLWELNGQMDELGDIPLQLGADVQVCMSSRTMHMAGIGEKLMPVEIKFPIYMLLVNPGISVSTAEIFLYRAKNRINFSNERMINHEICSLEALLKLLKDSQNDLQEVACITGPEISVVMDEIGKQQGNLFTAMSGSGATCYGIFSDENTANKAEDKIKAHKPNWWVQSVLI